MPQRSERRDPQSGRRIVHRVEDGMDRHDIAYTVYQMRNFYRQLGDGFFSVLDVMNYIQHHQVVRWCRSGNHVLDVCCGRGLLLPLLRYHVPKLGSYTGIDVEPANALFVDRRVTDGKPRAAGYYPFPVRFVQANAAHLHDHVQGPYDVLVYTSSIEHMHPQDGAASLVACRRVAKPGAILILTCPNTPPDRDGYDTQYRAHVYEWKRSELEDGLRTAGWQVLTCYGLLLERKELFAQARRLGFLPLLERLAQFVPTEWLVPVFAPYFPNQAREIGLLAKAV